MRTVETYTESVREFTEFLVRQGMPSQHEDVTREHVESFIEELLGKWKPATANFRNRGLCADFQALPSTFPGVLAVFNGVIYSINVHDAPHTISANSRLIVCQHVDIQSIAWMMCERW